MAGAQDIVVGQSGPLTGGNATLGMDIRDGALAYFKKVNDAGGIGGRKLQLVTLDDRNDTKLSAENTRKLIDTHKAVALFGYASATLSLPAMPAVNAAKVPFFGPFTGADVIRKQSEFVFTTRVTYADEIDKLINFWAPLGVTKILVLHYDDEVGKQNFETTARALGKFGKEPIPLAIKRNVDIAPDTVAQIKAKNPQIILATTLASPIVQIVKALKAQNTPLSVSSLSFASLSQITQGLGQDASGITVAVTVPTPSRRDIPIVEECLDVWQAAGYTRPLSTTALEACIDAKLLVEGMRRASKDVTRESLQRALAALGKINVGGLELAFRPRFHHGGTYVDIAIIRKNGELKA